MAKKQMGRWEMEVGDGGGGGDRGGDRGGGGGGQMVVEMEMEMEMDVGQNWTKTLEIPGELPQH